LIENFDEDWHALLWVLVIGLAVVTTVLLANR
jgi:hypothetical protein